MVSILIIKVVHKQPSLVFKGSIKFGVGLVGAETFHKVSEVAKSSLGLALG